MAKLAGIVSIKDKQTKNGKKMKLVTVGDETVSFWPNQMEDIKDGDNCDIEYEVAVVGDKSYKNGTAISKAGSAPAKGIEDLTPEELQTLAFKAKEKADAQKAERDKLEHEKTAREQAAAQKDRDVALRIVRCCFLNNAAQLYSSGKAIPMDGKSAASVVVEIAKELEEASKDWIVIPGDAA